MGMTEGRFEDKLVNAEAFILPSWSCCPASRRLKYFAMLLGRRDQQLVCFHPPNRIICKISVLSAQRHPPSPTTPLHRKTPLHAHMAMIRQICAVKSQVV